jgi:nucleoid-associated protein YgaU
MLFLAALSVGLALTAEVTPPAAAPAATPSTTAAPETFEQKERVKLKCEKLVELGSRMPRRVCRTPEQIKQVQEDARETTREFQKINPERIH